jgi:hypothetical protein
VKILAFLQNQWFKNPERAAAIYARRPELRRKLNARFLFAGCLTGRRLRMSLGDDLCREIEWEEVSKEVAGESSGAFPPDPKHVAAVLEEVKPDVVLLFGKIAEEIEHMVPCKVIKAPHPAARGKEIPGRLDAAAEELRIWLEGNEQSAI